MLSKYIFYSDDDEDLDSVLSSTGDYNSGHSTSSENTIIHSTDTDEEEVQVEEVMKKEKPKHTWFMVPEVINRQMGKKIFNLCQFRTFPFTIPTKINK